MSAQWVQLPDGTTLVASQAAAWLQPPVTAALGLRGPMPDSVPATADTTRHLLDGAIAAAERAAPPAADEPPITATRWAWHLVAQWYCAHHSVDLLPEAVACYDAAGRPDLAAFARRKLEEERGHDLFPLADLRALGYDADSLVRALAPPPSVHALVDYARGCVRGPQPVELLGYIYALERRVICIPETCLTELAGVLPAGVEAASGIRAHVSELDPEHVEEAITFITGLGAPDRTLIALGCFRTTRMTSAGRAAPLPGDAELDAWMSPFRRPPVDAEPLPGRTSRGATI
jgi:hypothetical protein